MKTCTAAPFLNKRVTDPSRFMSPKPTIPIKKFYLLRLDYDICKTRLTNYINNIMFLI